MSDQSYYRKRKEYNGQAPYARRFGSANFSSDLGRGESSLRAHGQSAMSVELRNLRIIELEYQVELLRLRKARLEKESRIREAREASMMHGPSMSGTIFSNSGEHDLRASYGQNTSAQSHRAVSSLEFGIAALPPIGTQESVGASSRNNELSASSARCRGVDRQGEFTREHSKILDRKKWSSDSHSTPVAIPSPRPNVWTTQGSSPSSDAEARGLQGTQQQSASNKRPPPSSSKETCDTLTIPLALPIDTKVLSPFQQLIRQSVELFQIQPDAMFTNVHGRTHKISPWQLGVRCRHCAHRPLHWRGRGSLYFPGCVAGVYQAAQNIANHHLMVTCPNIPADIREALQKTRGKQSARKGGGKQYWIDGCRNLGLCDREGEDGVWLKEDGTSF